MSEIGGKTVTFEKRPLDWAKHVLRALDRFPTLRTRQMMMVAFFCMVIDKMVVGLALVDGPGLLKDVQRAVDGGLIYSRHTLLNHVDNLLGRYMGVGVVNYIDDQPSLRCKL